MSARRDWRNIDRALDEITFLPPVTRRRAFRRLSMESGASVSQLRRRVDYLGLDLSDDAGEKAVAAYQARVQLIFAARSNYRKIMRLLRISLTERERRHWREMHDPISLTAAARFLGVSVWALRRWCRWLHAMEPDKDGKLRPYQLVEFLNSDYRWLLPAVKLPR